MILSFVMAMVLTGNPPEMMIPEGTVIPVVLNEKVSTNNVQVNDPILFSMADDIRASGHRGIVLIPRGSSVVGRVVRTDRAGHFVGRAMMDIRMEKIVTPDGEVYDGLNTKIVEVNKSKGEKGQMKMDGEIEGPVHRKRDAFFLLFPPTTIFQLMAIPARGPDVVLPPETRLYIKLMTPIYVERQGLTQASTLAMPTQAAPPPAQASTMAPAALPAPVLVPRYVAPTPVRYLSWQELDRIVSPIALYPDSLLYQILAACRDSNFQALSSYPDLVRRMSVDLTWVSGLGQAYRIQPNDVVGSVQRLRQQSRGFPPAD